jgi:hypothetical protein
MASKSKKKSSPKTQNKGKRRTRRKTRTGGGHKSAVGMGSALMRQICSITDPFCPAARGSKYPDQASGRTLAWTTEQFATLSTDANGRGAVFFSSDPADGLKAVNAWVGATTTVSTTLASQAYPGWATFVAVQGIQFRLVSYGVECRSVLSAMNNQGSMGILLVPSNPNAIASAGVNLDSLQYPANVRCSMSDPRGLTCVPRDDGTVARLFTQSLAGTTTNVVSEGWDIPCVYIVGGPATTPALQIRVVLHYELMFSSDSIFNSMATPAALENNAAQTGSNFVKRSVDAVVKGGIAEVEKQTMNWAATFGKRLVQGAAGAIGGYFGGPVGGALASGSMGMIMDVD